MIDFDIKNHILINLKEDKWSTWDLSYYFGKDHFEVFYYLTFKYRKQYVGRIYYGTERFEI